jgi:hypothetical protein
MKSKERSFSPVIADTLQGLKPTIDIVVIPTVRPYGHLITGIKLAKETAAYLVVLCSGSASAIEASHQMSLSGVPGVAIAIPSIYVHAMLTDFRTDVFLRVFNGRKDNDLSLKRNLGLLIGRLTNKQLLFFLDDDVEIAQGHIASTAKALIDAPIAGFFVEDFPDNSVVRHAQRLCGIEPGVHVAGGALGVSVERAAGFFPNIYNEDWFFMYANNEMPIPIGSIRQHPYDPFDNPLRAASEEFGDVLAEGLSKTICSGHQITDLQKRSWHNILNERKKLIYSIRERLGYIDTASESELDHIDATLCHDYIKAWLSDIELWHNRLSKIEKHLSITEAINYLDLMQNADFSEKN